ncbi:FAD-dependent oxidoreductase [Rhodococcus hoagii]|nr:FAD-dependent oxidoreductase [Prescottella equi]
MQYIRREPNGHLLVGNSDHSNPESPIRTPIPTALPRTSSRPRSADSTASCPTCRIPRLASSYAGCYDITPDYNPIIGPSPAAGLFLAVGFSGHGFKISPAVGRLAPIYCSTDQ